MPVSHKQIELTIQWFSRRFAADKQYRYPTTKEIEELAAILVPSVPETDEELLDRFLAPPEPVSAKDSVQKILERSAGHAAGLLSPNLADEIVAAVRQVDRVPRSLISALAIVYRSVEGEDRARIAVIACRLGVNKEVESLAQSDKESAL